MSADQRVFWRSGACTVWVGLDADGALRFDGYDREHVDGYEYTVTVAPDQFDCAAPRPGRRAADAVDLVCEHVDGIMARGERTWLEDHGIDCGFHSG